MARPGPIKRLLRRLPFYASVLVHRIKRAEVLLSSWMAVARADETPELVPRRELVMLLVWVLLGIFSVASLVATVVLYAAVVTSARVSAEIEQQESISGARRIQSSDTPRNARPTHPPTCQKGEWAQPQ